MSLVTMSVVFRDEEKNLPHLLESIEKEVLKKHRDSFHFIFVDNSSTDRSLELIKSWRKEFSISKIETIQRNENNMAQARQQVLDACSSPWLVFVDADSILEKDWASILLRTIDQIPENVVSVGGGAPYKTNLGWHSFVLPLANYFPLGRMASQRRPVDHVPSNNYLIRTEAAKEAGGFDPFFDRVGEDLDFNVRLRKQGTILFDPVFNVSHQLPESQTAWFTKMAYYGRAQSYVFLKYWGEVPLVKFFPLLALLSLCWSVFYLPELALVFFVLMLISQRIWFVSMTFFFYGLGELVGALRFLVAYRLRFAYDGRIQQRAKIK